MSIFTKILDWLPFDDSYDVTIPPQPAAPGDIWREIDAVQVEFSAFSRYDGGYCVTLKRKSERFGFETKGEGRSFNEALADAWARMPRP